jgi:hypothetical protein
MFIATGKFKCTRIRGGGEKINVRSEENAFHFIAHESAVLTGNSVSKTSGNNWSHSA